MSKPRHQHYIPKSYLKNFAVEQDKKYFVEAKLKEEENPKANYISIKDICVDKNIYTIPTEDTDKKYAIEKYYASEIDSIYPEIYRLLIDESITEINDAQRRKIILTTMSLFFRTPKFFDFYEKRIDEILFNAIENCSDKDGWVKIHMNELQIDFHIQQFEEIKKQLHIVNKLNFLENHLKDLHDFVEFKMQAGISVMTIRGDIDLITSDNPVEIHSVVKNLFHPFDPTNIIQLPIDNRHYLIIYPNTEVIVKDRIFRDERDFYFTLTANYNVENNSVDWILGKPGTIHAHIKNQKKYFEETPENLTMMSELEETSKDLKQLGNLIDNYGLLHATTIKEIEKLAKKTLHQNNNNLRNAYEELKRTGYIN